MLRPLGYITITVFLAVSCSNLRTSQFNAELKSQKLRFKLTDVSGSYVLNSSTGFGKDREYIKKERLVSAKSKNEVFEKTIIISKKRKFNKDVQFLAPLKYESSYYLQKDLYTVSGRIDYSKREIIYNLNSPEFKWLGQKRFMIPKQVKALCFYGNIIGCAKVSGFISKSIEMKNGDMNFHILWESFPYFQEQFLNLPKEIIAFAVLAYDGVDKKGNFRFLLTTGGQSQVYLLNKKLDMVGHFWTAQGLSKERIK